MPWFSNRVVVQPQRCCSAAGLLFSSCAVVQLQQVCCSASSVGFVGLLASAPPVAPRLFGFDGGEGCTGGGAPYWAANKNAEGEGTPPLVFGPPDDAGAGTVVVIDR